MPSERKKCGAQPCCWLVGWQLVWSLLTDWLVGSWTEVCWLAGLQLIWSLLTGWFAAGLKLLTGWFAAGLKFADWLVCSWSEVCWLVGLQLVWCLLTGWLAAGLKFADWLVGSSSWLMMTNSWSARQKEILLFSQFWLLNHEDLGGHKWIVDNHKIHFEQYFAYVGDFFKTTVLRNFYKKVNKRENFANTFYSYVPAEERIFQKGHAHL